MCEQAGMNFQSRSNHTKWIFSFRHYQQYVTPIERICELCSHSTSLAKTPTGTRTAARISLGHSWGSEGKNCFPQTKSFHFEHSSVLRTASAPCKWQSQRHAANSERIWFGPLICVTAPQNVNLRMYSVNRCWSSQINVCLVWCEKGLELETNAANARYNPAPCANATWMPKRRNLAWNFKHSPKQNCKCDTIETCRHAWTTNHIRMEDLVPFTRRKIWKIGTRLIFVCFCLVCRMLNKIGLMPT